MEKYINSPYKEIPEELIPKYTMNNQIPILDWWLDGTNDLESTTWNDNYIDSYTSKFTNENIKKNLHGEEPYHNASKMILSAIEKYNITQKNVAVLGSLTPWIEAILLNNNNNVTTIEYNIPDLKTNKLSITDYWNFIKSDKKYDCIITYSSVEHSGLGRYGDPLDPDGDLKTMENLHKHLIDNGLLFFGAPIGKDALVWNVHRVYGNIRMPILFNNFKELEWIGGQKNMLNLPLRNNGSQPLIVLQK